MGWICDCGAAGTGSNSTHVCQSRRRRQVIRVDASTAPDEQRRFRVWVDGFMEYWTLDKIKQAIKDGDDVKEWER